MNFTREQVGPITLVSTTTKRGIKVTGAYIREYPPEMQAATGATLSRDPGSIESRLKKIFSNEKTAQRILDVFFKQYGHNSIGDMGHIVFSIEGLSMKGAFSLVEHRLFNGQEASTRYLDFSEMGFLPVSSEVDKLSKESMALYQKILESEIKKNLANGMSQKEAEPKAFDVAGAFLPASARTNVYWDGTIRVLIDKIRELRSMGDEEKEIGNAMSKIFDEIAPNSQRDLGEYAVFDQIKMNKKIYSLVEEETSCFAGGDKDKLSFCSFDIHLFKKFIEKETTREAKKINIKAAAIFGLITANFAFDFRSARDIHRHRAFNINTIYNWKPRGFESFYFEQISDESLLKEAIRIEKKTQALLSDTVGDYFVYGTPMAMKYSYIISGTLDVWLYFLNLRSGPKVHPTVIALSQKIGFIIEDNLGLKNVYQRGGVNYLKRSGDKNKI